MKSKINIRIISYFILSILLLSNFSGASMPETLKITTEKNILYSVKYDGYEINARRINVEGSNDVTYCLEINKDYPSGNSFSISDEINEKLNNLLAAGYPNKSPIELNLDNKDEAYFATQVAMWSLISGLDVNKMTGDNPKIIEAIKTIYNDGISGKYTPVFKSKIYKTNNSSIQDVVVVSYDDLISEEKGESIQEEYPPQEG